MRLLVVSGDNHPNEKSTQVLEGFLMAASHDVTLTEVVGVLASARSAT